MREIDVAAEAKRWLKCKGLSVYQEVVVEEARCDLVGTGEPGLIAVECKLGLGFDVIAQALRWVDCANEVWVAVRHQPRESNARLLAVEFCRGRGVGVLTVLTGRTAVVSTRVRAAHRHPKHLDRMRVALHPEQKTAAPAGTNGGGYVTDWKLWSARFVDYVRDHSGCGLKEAIEATSPYFCSTAYNRLRLVQSKLRQHRRPPEFAGVVLVGKGAKALVQWEPPETF